MYVAGGQRCGMRARTPLIVCARSVGVAVGASNGALGCLRVCRSCVVVSVPGGGTLNCGDGPSYPSWATPSQLYISDQTRMGATVDAFENLDRGYERGCVLFGAVSVLKPGGGTCAEALARPGVDRGPGGDVPTGCGHVQNRLEMTTWSVKSHEMRVWAYKVAFSPSPTLPRVVRDEGSWCNARITKKRLRRPKPGSARGDSK